MSTSWRGEPTDVLCYGFDPEKNKLHDLAQDIARRQRENTKEVYENLRRRGYTFAQQQESLKEGEGELEHPHELLAILEKPSAQQPHELVALLKKYSYGTGETSPGKILTDAGCDFVTNDIAVVVDAAHRSGAVCLIAHPGRGDGFTRFDPSLLDQLHQEVPIDGLEVYYPAHTPEQITMYQEYAQQHRFLTSSGSDSHGPDHKPIKYPAELSRGLLEWVGIHIK